MAPFHPPNHFAHPKDELVLLPFNFERTEADSFLVSNMVGDFIRLSESELNRVANLEFDANDGLYERAYSAHLVAGRNQKSQKQLLALRLRSRMDYLRHLTGLHIFVVTLRCDHSCPYCQVSRQGSDSSHHDMSEEFADRALDIALQSPSSRIKIEFQGGEPLLNFPLIKKIVLDAKAKSAGLGKVVDFVICSNFALLDDEVLEFCKSHEILLSTSLDGPADLHNKNRPRSGVNSYDLAVSGIRRAQTMLGFDRVGALMTTTEASLDHAADIVDEYVSLGLDGVFLRPLSPYGFALKTKQFHRYDAKSWLAFYERGLRRILEINHQGTTFREFYTALILTRMLTDKSIGYVDLRSPAGTGLGVLLYNYDGRVFVSDEGRMLAEMGDSEFQIGHVEADDYKSLILSDKLIDIVSQSLTQCAPECSTCVFEPHCGASPVFHYATQGDLVGIKPLSEFCERQRGIMRLLLDILENSPRDAAVLRSWAG